MSKQVRKDIVSIVITSISANAISLMAQLQEYEFLSVTPEQFKRLDKIEQEFHKLVQEITQS